MGGSKTELLILQNETGIRNELNKALSSFSVRLNVPLKLDNSDRHFQGERARIEFVPNEEFDGISAVIIHFNQTVFMEVLHWEVGRIKMRCMEVPIYERPIDMPEFEEYLLSLASGFYNWQLIDSISPAIAKELIKDQIIEIPPVERLRIAANSVPFRGTIEWHQGFENFERLVLDKLACSRSKNLGRYAETFEAALQIFDGSSIQADLDFIESELSKMPPFRSENSQFTRDEIDAMKRVVNFIHQRIFRGRPLPTVAVLPKICV